MTVVRVVIHAVVVVALQIRIVVVRRVVVAVIGIVRR